MPVAVSLGHIHTSVSLWKNSTVPMNEICNWHHKAMRGFQDSTIKKQIHKLQSLSAGM